ncbi:MAG: GspE/PulE family protein [Candidatus Eremiobacteraeota bacterium]|nr:GspE/PulE family protein [Candidatus Eremiobacteraeota bacterium]
MGVTFQDGRSGLLTDLAGYEVSSDLLRRVPRALALRYDILAMAADGNQLTVALPPTAGDDVIDRLRLATGMQVRAVHAPVEVIRELLTSYYPDIPQTGSGAARGREDEAPAIRTVDRIHDAAVLARASDLHVEPTRERGRVRQRVDGIMHEVLDVPAELFAPVVSRIKLLAGMDIADRRQPQDGRYTFEAHGRSIDARVASMPTIIGEKLVIRLLDHQTQIPTPENLGMSPDTLQRFRRISHAPHGFVIVCGPTGSGKTTTLYATLAERNLQTQNLCSVEDPVEIRISGVSQVQVNLRAGLTFASALRSFLRQDPNVIMVGEMRDCETANVAVSAALSGQLVMTTLHSNDSVTAIDRLLELGVERHAIASAVTGIVAQRLVRKLCVACREPRAVGLKHATRFGLQDGVRIFEARGCSKCSQAGYRGRTAIFELLLVNDTIRDAIAKGASTVSIGALARAAGHAPMVVDGHQKVLAGTTSIEELQRVLAFENP